jgi:flagellin
MSVINTNVKSLVAQNAMTVNNRSLSKSMEQLSTGSRINSAADDAAGLAISNKMTAQIRGMNQAVRNANDGISLIQTAEGATKEITNMLQRMRELAVQSANDTNTKEDRSALALEATELTAEIERIATNTQWNGMKIFENAVSKSDVGDTAGTAKLQVGSNTSDVTIDVTFRGFEAVDLGIETAKFDLTDQAKSQDSIKVVDEAIALVDAERAMYGAIINRLTSAADNLSNVSQNTAASRSRILDTDYASATTELARTQIIQQAATAMLAQANQAPQSVLSLLR